MTIASIAEQILHDKGQGKAIPTDLAALYRNEGVDVRFFDSTQEFDGRVELCLNRPTIYVNTRFRPPQQSRARFTLAHELGHFFLHRQHLRLGRVFVDKFIRFGTLLDSLEVEANEFASECLLPTEIVRGVIENKILSLELVQSLAERAQASSQATAIKIASIATACSCFFWLEQRVVRWTAPSAKWKEQKYPWSAWQARTVDGSLAATADSSVETTAVPRRVWCPRAPARDEPLYESAQRTPYGTLVLVLDLANWSP